MQSTAAVALAQTSLQFGTPERVEHHLENWRRWHHSGQVGEGYPSRTPGTVNWSLKSDFEGMLERCDQQSATALEVFITEDMPVAEACAIQHRYLHAVYRFPRQNFAPLLEQAKVRIGLWLSKRSIY